MGSGDRSTLRSCLAEVRVVEEVKEELIEKMRKSAKTKESIKMCLFFERSARAEGSYT